MTNKDIPFAEEVVEFFVKIFVPAAVAISIKVATQIKKERLTVSRVIQSFIAGVGCAYFVYPFVSGRWTPLIVGIVAMSGEKIAEYIIYKWDVDKVIGSIFTAIVDTIINAISPKK